MFYGIHDYYGEAGIREICHAVKDSSHPLLQKKAIYYIADDFLCRDIVHKGDFLIPAPNHLGRAVYTKMIAEIVVSYTGALLCDILRCFPHKPLYFQKLDHDDIDLFLYLSRPAPEGGRLFFVDNVIDTGTTFSKANKLFHGHLYPLIFAEHRK